MCNISRHGATLHGTADGFDAIPLLISPAIALFFVPSHVRPSRGIPVAEAAASLDRIDSEERYGRTQSD
jgi:hypothetical protein